MSEHLVQLSHNRLINVSICGEGFPLVLLHGNSEDHSYFAPQISYFSTKYRVIAIDSYAHGKSNYLGEALSIELLADIVIETLDKLEVSQAIVLGFSDGANIATAVALAKPELCSKLILYSSNLCPYGVKAYFQIPVTIGYCLLKCVSIFTNKFRRLTEVVGLMVKYPTLSGQDLEVLDMPTLVIAGTKDVIKANHTELIARSVKQAKLVMLEGSHVLSSVSPDVFNKCVDDFLQC